jgi:hypothetical protein
MFEVTGPRRIPHRIADGGRRQDSFKIGSAVVGFAAAGGAVEWNGRLSTGQWRQGTMVYHGHVENGLIRLEGSVTLPEGIEVRVETVSPAPGVESNEGGLSLYERLRPVIGAAKGLPADASVNVDHYLYGHPKK